jgi:hypothetical protein
MPNTKYLNYNFFFQSLHTLDLLANQCQATLLQRSFTLDCLEYFKPIAEIFAALLVNPLRETDDQTLKLTIERLKSFFSVMKRKGDQ